MVKINLTPTPSPTGRGEKSKEFTTYTGRYEPARDLRKTQTQAEKKLWFRLRSRLLGNYKFRRQLPIGNFIVDFCCLEEKLVIELDGEIHCFTYDQDENRSYYLRERGFRILRFRNDEVINKIDAVCTKILSALNTSRTNDPLPVGEGTAGETPTAGGEVHGQN